uniref:Thioredoxin-like fold domain-containing protein n=1 Tax=Mycena chlorophos TaxID=658473 RepID=A0ABQ0LNV6_MYCCL|nr:predicted protein [Mycena chlorophos]
MALQPSLRPLIIAGPADAPHTLDIFLDYACPFSAKIALVMDKVLLPALGPGGKYDGKVKLIFRPQVQPWHTSSIFLIEAGLAAARISPSLFWRFSLLLFAQHHEFTNMPCAELTPTQIRAKIAVLASQVLPTENVAAFSALLEPKADLRGSNEVTEEVKYTLKFSRQNSIHVSPTVLWDGLVASEVSSSWGEKEWDTFFQAKVLV